MTSTSTAASGAVSRGGSGRHRFRQVDTMRALAALSVVLYHAGSMQMRPGATFLNYIDEHAAGPPVTAVVLFFLISGFVLYRPFVRARFEQGPAPPLLPYAVHRLARIVPAYWLALTVVSIWFGYHYMWHPSGFIRYYFFLQIYAKPHTFLGGLAVAWSLCVEVSFYVALPLLAFAARRLGRRLPLIGSELLLAVGMLIASILWQLFVGGSGWAVRHDLAFPMLSMLPGMLELFAAGMLLAVFSVEYDRGDTRRRAAVWINAHPAVLWLLAAVLFYVEGRLGGRVARSIGIGGWWAITLLLKMVSCALLLAPLAIGSQDKGLLRRVLGSPALVWLGGVSYGIYLWHFPILQRLHPLLPHVGLFVITACVAVLATAAAAASSYLLERPVQRVAKRLVDGRRAPAVEPAAAVTTPAS
jgi:peptidoglycan/LPS O-acetylase OafA/YrhL